MAALRQISIIALHSELKGGKSEIWTDNAAPLKKPPLILALRQTIRYTLVRSN